jgi:hypothetical protein
MLVRAPTKKATAENTPCASLGARSTPSASWCQWGLNPSGDPECASG